MQQNDPLFLAGNLAFVDEIYAQYRRDPSQVHESGRRLFAEEGDGATILTLVPGARGGNGAAAQAAARPLEAVDELFLAKVWAMVNAYRARGHLEANLDPLGLVKPVPHSEL